MHELDQKIRSELSQNEQKIIGIDSLSTFIRSEQKMNIIKQQEMLLKKSYLPFSHGSIFGLQPNGSFCDLIWACAKSCKEQVLVPIVANRSILIGLNSM